MSPSGRRIWVLAAVFLAGVSAVVLHLGFLTVVQHESWLVRSYRNRWTFRDVPTRRGSLLDSQGRIVATDRPSFEVLGNYRLFRRHHPVGAAVHGANLLYEAEGWIPDYFGYRDRSGDPLQAFDALMRVPLASLRGEHFSDAEDGGAIARDLRFYAVAVLSACTGRPRWSVSLQLSKAMAEERSSLQVWQTVAEDPDLLRGVFQERWEELLAMEAQLQEVQREGGEELIEVLEGWRQKRRRLETPENDGRSWRQEDWYLPIQDHLPFELAAQIRLQQRQHPGLQLSPDVERIYHPLPGREDSGSLAAVVGQVTVLDRADTAFHVDDLVADAMEGFDPWGGLEDGPETLGETAVRSAQAAMRRYYESRGRTGSFGAESALDNALAGTPGLRWAERNRSAREQFLLSSLDVSPGRDVRLTLDLDLQNVLESVVDRAFAAPDPAGEVALVLIDAERGDILAMAGRPLRVKGTLEDGTEMMMLNAWAPGLGSQGPPDVGSVAKPFVLLEDLSAIREGRLYKPLSEFTPCPGKVQVAGMHLGCGSPHGQLDAVAALAESCNVFFFQVAEGLELPGLHHAYQRVGWMRGDAPSPAYQEDIPGIGSVARPRLNPNGQVLEQQAIGYGVQVNALYVARAYAALATGSLPRLRLVVDGEPGPALSLGVDPDDLQVVRLGLRACVETGTASSVRWHARLDVHGKTGTAEVGPEGQNNAWFAGYLPRTGPGAPVLAFAAVAYFAPDKTHGGEIAGGMVAELLRGIDQDEELHRRYLPREVQR